MPAYIVDDKYDDDYGDVVDDDDDDEDDDDDDDNCRRCTERSLLALNSQLKVHFLTFSHVPFLMPSIFYADI